MKLKDVENKMNMLEKIVRDGQNYGRDDRMGRASSAFRMYNTYNADLDDEAEDIVSKGNKLLGKFLDLKDKFSEVAVRYAQVNSQYIYLLFEQIAGQKKSMDRLEQREINKNVKEAFAELCALVRETLEKTNLIDILMNRENKALSQLGIRRYTVKKEKVGKKVVEKIEEVGEFISAEYIENYKNELLSERSVYNTTSISEEIRNQAMCLFWVNKISKVIDDCMLGYMIEKVSLANNEGKKKDISEVTEEEKKIALLRLDFIKSIYRYCDSRFGKDFDMSSDADFELFLDSKGVNFYFPDFLRYITCQKTTVKGYEEIKRYFDRNSDLKSFYEKLPKDFIEKIMEMDSRYNQLFAEKDSIPEMTFIHDAFMFAQLNELKSAIYDMKAELTSVLAYILLVQKNMGSNPFCKEWGFLRDTKSHDDSNISNVLYVELPGHIQPLMVHMEDMLLDGIEITDLYFPEYNGLFKGANSSGLESYLSTHVLFRLSNTPGDNQLNSLKLSKKLKKAAIDRRKKEIDKMPEGLEKRSAEKIWLRECKYYRMIEYMEAMAKDKARNIGQDI